MAKEAEVIELARSVVKIPSKWGYSDVGDVLVSMLKNEIAPEEAYFQLKCLIEDF